MALSFRGSAEKRAAANLLTVGALVSDLYNVTFGGQTNKEKDETDSRGANRTPCWRIGLLGLPGPS